MSRGNQFSEMTFESKFAILPCLLEVTDKRLYSIRYFIWFVVGLLNILCCFATPKEIINITQNAMQLHKDIVIFIICYCSISKLVDSHIIKFTLLSIIKNIFILFKFYYSLSFYILKKIQSLV